MNHSSIRLRQARRVGYTAKKKVLAIATVSLSGTNSICAAPIQQCPTLKVNDMKLARILVSALLVVGASMAHALDTKPYTADALAAAQKAGQSVAVMFHADWCPTCRAQDKVLQSMKAEKGLDLTVLVANYDTEKDLKRRFRVNSQSTIVVLKGTKETARLIGDTRADGIRGALKSAL